MVPEDQTNPAQAENIVNWKNAPTLEALKQDLQEAKPSHDSHITKVKKWLDNLHVRNAAATKTGNGGSTITPKLIRKQAEWRYPALSDPFLSTSRLFKVSPTTWEDKKASEQNALVLNNQFNTKINKQRLIDEYVRAVVDEGTAILRVGWSFEEEPYEADEPIIEFRVNPEYGPLHEELVQLKQNSPSEYVTNVPDELKQAHDLFLEQGVPVEPAILGYRKVKKNRVVKNHPTVEVCDQQNVIIDPSCNGDLTKAGFVVYTFETSLAKLKKDKRYKNLDQIETGNYSPLNEPDHATHSGNFNFRDKPRQLFVVYEYWGNWDINGDGVLVPIVVSWVGNTIIRMEANPFPDKLHPFVAVAYLPVRKQVHGEPDGELLEDNQKIIGAVTRGMIDLLGKSANGQTGMRKDMLDATNRRKFDKGMDYEFNPNVDPRQGVHMHTYPEIPASAQFMLQLQQAEAESMSGVKAFNDGISGQSFGQVAAGVRGALDAASKREMSILNRLKQGIVEVGRKIIAMNQEFLSEEEVVRVTNDDFVLVRRDDLAGNFDLELDISTAEEDANKSQELGFMLQTMGPNMDPAISRIILADIAKLKKMPDLAKKIEEYEPQPDPLAQRKLQLEIELLEAQLENERAQAMQRQAQAQLDMARSGTEQAKTDNLRSDTDLKNLNFVEQESGVTQQRALQLHGEQARSQAQLKLLEREDRKEDRRTDLLKTYIQTQAKQKSA